MHTRARRTLVSWSSGKDSAWALHVLRQQPDVEVVGLLTTVNEAHDRVAMHAVRRSLLELQAEAAGLPLWPLDIPNPCTNEQYEAAMGAVVERAAAEGIAQIAFGDLFLEDVRAYREEKLAGTGVEPVFPLWQRPTHALARDMIRAGVKALVTCVDPGQVPADCAGRVWDEAFVGALPDSADPCGERGEFHTFVVEGPMLDRALRVEVGEVVARDGFVFADVTPA